MSLRYRPMWERWLGGESCPAVPVLFWKHHPVADQDSGALCRATLAFQESFDCDLVKISPASTYQLPDYGLQDVWDGDPIGRRLVTRTVVARPEDWLRLARLDPAAGFVARFGECVRMVRRESSPEVPVIITVFDPMSQAVILAGHELIRDHLRDTPDAVAAGLARITENTVALIAHLIGQGADGIFLASQHANHDGIPQRVFERHGMPGVLACLEAMAGLDCNMLHAHGAHVYHELFVGLGVPIHYDMWAENPPPSWFLDAGCAVATGPSPALLASGATDDEVSAACSALTEEGGRTVLSPGCSVPLSVEAGRLRLITQAARSRRLT